MSGKNDKQKPVIGITIGDINGIGPEVIIRALDDSRITKFLIPVIYASGGLISYFRKSMNREHFSYFQTKDIRDINRKRVNVLNIWDEKVEVNAGAVNPTGGIYAKQSLERAVEDLKNEQLHALVTGPLNKQLLSEQEFDFPGHTEYLANAFGASDSLMLMVHQDLRVGVVTGHILLRDVPGAITEETITQKLQIMLKSLQKDFGIKKPKVAVLGLNPHAGENGLLGDEEQTTISKAIHSAKQGGHLIFGPYPADGFFGSNQFTNFDGILAMYHDQGLIPFKYISGAEGVNYTAGIPAIRTSPAHGTAYNLAGKHLADESSMRNAIFLAADLARRRIPELVDYHI